MNSITNTGSKWLNIADRLFEGNLPFPNGTTQRMAPDLAEYITSQVSVSELDERVTLEFGDEGWDAALCIHLAS